MDAKELSRIVQEYVTIEGASSAGIATLETLEGGPPSTDLTYVLPGARSAVSFAVPIDPRTIVPYLAKRDRLSYETAYVHASALASGIAFHLSNYLNQRGYLSVPVADNCVYREDSSGGLYGYYPDIAHRYLAVRSGVGFMGLSGNIITQDHGAAVILAATVTAADLMPTAPLSFEDSYCDDCGLCLASCVSGFMHRTQRTRVNLGGHEIAYSQRGHYGRCDCVCSGYTGLHSSGQWSTWSPGRRPIPSNDDEVNAAQEDMIERHAAWPHAAGGRYFFFTEGKMRTSCGNCQLVCHPDRDEREARYKTLIESGVVVQDPDGTLRSVSPEDAEAMLRNMVPEKRSLYEDVDTL